MKTTSHIELVSFLWKEYVSKILFVATLLAVVGLTFWALETQDSATDAAILQKMFNECTRGGGDMLSWDYTLKVWVCFDTPNNIVKIFED